MRGTMRGTKTKTFQKPTKKKYINENGIEDDQQHRCYNALTENEEAHLTIQNHKTRYHNLSKHQIPYFLPKIYI